MITLTINTNGDLVIFPDAELTEEDFGYLRDMPTISAWGELLEDYTCNGWDWVSFGLTDAPQITETAIYDGEDDIIDADTIYWHSDYAVEDPIDMLLSGKPVIWQKSV